ncbi:hypothetical protein DMB66_26285 [Actinoplanes sp. ATCC 53533]|uniref:hypothetical protein n=1 Tax=Actinoplanes sp. ATCC 53533 TaxID=1288362 RepID=UPI000F795A30|nr:hypothetical protein [Actinoplanes sp. ATCC 53533]RSM59765.1 hypothetical protein DMB66_26285 [Actinoplanes sp. ATCC 53533]
MNEPNPDGIRALAEIAESLAADGQWDHAVEAARSVLRLSEMLAEAEPDRFAPAVEQARERVERLVAEANAVGAPAALAPSPHIVDLVAAAAPEFATARTMAADLDRLDTIRARELRRADPSVRDAVEHARRLQLTSPRAIAEKLARHAAVLWLFDRRDLAHDAAVEAVRLYSAIDPETLDPADDGYCAYNLLILGIGWFGADEISAARQMLEQAVGLFYHHVGLLGSANMFDLARALTILARCQAQQGATDQARQSIVDANAIAERTDRTVAGEPGSMPSAAWGLPVVPSREDVRALYG